MSTPSRFEVEHQHRLMMQASVDAAALERRAREAEHDDGLRGLLRDWKDAVATISSAFDRARTDLLRDGTDSEQILRVEDCLSSLKSGISSFEVGDSLDDCVGRWQSLAFEIRQLEGEQRENLERLLKRLQYDIDRATDGLSQARQNDGLSPEKYRIARELRSNADDGRKKYERLREEYLEAEKAHQKALAVEQAAQRAAELARVTSQAAATQQAVPQQFLNWHFAGSAVRATPTLVRLPDPRSATPGFSAKVTSTKGAATAAPPVLPKVVAHSTPSIPSGLPKPPAFNPNVGVHHGGPRLEGPGFSETVKPDRIIRGNLAQLQQFDPKVAAQVKHGLPNQPTHFDPKVPQHGAGVKPGLPAHAHTAGFNPNVGVHHGGPRLDRPGFSETVRPDRIIPGKHSTFDPTVKPVRPVRPSIPSGFQPTVQPDHVVHGHDPVTPHATPQHAAPFNPTVKPDHVVRPSIPSGFQPVVKPDHVVHAPVAPHAAPFNPYVNPHHGGPVLHQPFSPTVKPDRIISGKHPAAPFNPQVKPNQIVHAPQQKPFDGRGPIRPQHQTHGPFNPNVPVHHREEPRKPFDGRVVSHRELQHHDKPFDGRVHTTPAQSLIHAQRPVPIHQAAAARPSGPLKVSLERIERVAGFPSGVDGIGRGNQTAHIFFRAENFHGGLSVGGVQGVSLGASCRLDVAPMVTLFSNVSGAPLRGKLSLGLISSGGRLVGIKPKEAHDTARSQARAAAREVAEKVGPIGKELTSAIADVLEDAANKIFARAQPGAIQNKLPAHQAGNHGHHQHGHHRRAHHKHHEQHHALHFNAVLGEILHEARAAKAPGGKKHHGKHGMHHLVHHEQHHHVASKLEKTLSHLATATHRVLTDTHAGELRGQLARLDALLASLKGKIGHELIEGTQAIGQVLSHMGGVVSTAGGAPHIASFRGLLNERKTQLAQIAGAARKHMGAEVAHKHGQRGFQLPSTQVLGEKALEQLRKQHPGLEKLLRNASHSQLAAELVRKAGGGLETLLGRGEPHGRHGKHHRHHRHHRHHAQGAHHATGLALGGLGFGGIGGALAGAGHLGGFGGLASLGAHGGLTKLFAHELSHQARRLPAHDIGKLLGHFKAAPHGSPLALIAKHTEERSKHLHAKHGGRKGKAPAHITAQALVEAFKTHGKGGFAAHVAPGGALYHLANATQRTRGGAISATASHYLQSRGSSHLWNAVSTFHGLVKAGHKPHHSLWSWAKDRAKSAIATVSSVADAVSSGVSKVTNLALATANLVTPGISNFGSSPIGAVSKGVGEHQGKGMFGKRRKGLRHLGDKLGKYGHNPYDKASHLGEAAWAGMMKKGAGALQQGFGAGAIGGATAIGGAGGIGGATAWAQRTAGGSTGWLNRQIDKGKSFARGPAPKGIDGVNKTGVVGAIGEGLRGGMHLLGNVWNALPLGKAVSAGWGKNKSPLGQIWSSTKSLAGKAWGGIKSAYKATSGFLQSPAGQFLVTGLSLAASFIPGGLLVKSLIGAGIGAIQAVSEGKDLKGILMSAGSGALSAAVPFLKMGPLAKVGMGALTSAVGTLAQGGSFKDALKSGVGGAVDAFDPGAMKSLGRLKSLGAAEKLLKGGKLSGLEKIAMKSGKAAGPLRMLEKALANPKIRKTVGGLEKVGGKVVKGGIYVSGKAAKVQGVLDKALAMGDKLDGALVQIHDQAPGIAGFFGDNAVGHFINKVGDYAGKGDEKLHKALEYGHAGSDKLTQYRGYLDKGLNYVGVKNPAKAYEKMSARKDLRDGKKGGAQHVAQLKLDAHKAKHPELYEATKAKGKGLHGGGKSAPKGKPEHGGEHHAAHGRHPAHAGGHGGHAAPHGGGHPGAHGGQAPSMHKPNKHGNKPLTAIEKAIAKGKSLQKKGVVIAQSVHDKTGKLSELVEKGLKGANEVQSGLEKAAALARQGSAYLGEDNELGAFLGHMSERADQMHGYLETGIGYAEGFQKGVGKIHDLSGKVPGVHDEEGEGEEGGSGRGHRRHPGGHGHPLDGAHHLEGGGAHGGKGKRKGGTSADFTPHPHDVKTKPHSNPPAGKKVVPGAHETDDAHAKRMKQAWDQLANVSAQVQRFDASYAKTLARVQTLLKENKANAASIELQGLGSEVAEIGKVVSRAKTLAKGNEGYEKEAKFYEEWAAKARTKVHTAIADTKGLGAQVQISGFGIDEKRHPDIFANTRDIYSVQAKVNAFGDALGDSSAKAHVEKVLAEAKAARSHLQSLKSKYKSDKAALKFLSDGGMQDKLIDESIAKLEKALKGGHAAGPHGKQPAHGPTSKPVDHKQPHEVRKKTEHGLKAIEAYKKRALKFGHKVDQNLGKVEHALKRGITIGKKVDAGMEKIGNIADQVAGFLGDDSPLGHLAHQAAGTAHSGHDKLHSALGMAGKAKQGLGKGRDILHEMMGKAAEAHEKTMPKVPHGHAHPEHHHLENGLHPSKHPAHPAHHPAHPTHPAHGPHPHHPAHPPQGHGLHLPHLPHLHRPHLQMPEWLKNLLGLGKGHGGGESPHAPGQHHQQADPAQLVQEAAHAVQHFGKSVKSAIAEVEKLMHAQKTKEAGDRVHAISGVSESTRAKVTRAVVGAAKHAHLAKHAASLKAHYLEIRAHLFNFVHTLHGLGGQDAGVDAGKYPDIHKVAVAIDSLGVKVAALGDLKHGDSHLQAHVSALKTEAAGLHKKLDALHGKHAKDKSALQAIQGLYSKLGRLQRMLSGHADPANVQTGNQNLDVKPPAPTKHPRRKRRRRKHHVHDPIADVLGAGGEGRIFVDRGGNRGEADHHDGQDVDPSATDTWLGSGEGVKLFSEVFGAFIPAEGAAKPGKHHTQHGHSSHGGGGEHEDPHFAHHGLGEHGAPAPHGGGGHHGDPSHPDHPDHPGHGGRGHHAGHHGGGHHSAPGRRGPKRKGRAHRGHRRMPHGKQGHGGGGFFHGLFEHLEHFADGVAHAAHSGESFLGKAMHFAEEGIHGLKAVEDAAEKVQEFAGKAEGFLNKFHLGKAAHFAHQIGSAAGTVDKDAKLLQGGLTTADNWMGKGKKELGAVESFSNKASGAFKQAEHNHFGGLLNLFKSSRGGDGLDGKLQPDKVQIGSNFDEPRRIDGGTLSKMEGFLGSDFAHVRIHTGPGAGIITRKFDAEAVTVKDHIFFAPGRFNTQSVEGQKLLAHELTHVKQMGRANLDVRTAEGEALSAEHSFGAPAMETLNLSQPQADFKLADGEGLGASTGIHTAKRSRSKGHEAGGKDDLPDGDEFLEKVSNRVYDLLMEELEQSFESR